MKTQLRTLRRDIDAQEKALNTKQREVTTAKAKAKDAQDRGNNTAYDQYVLEAALAENSVTQISATRAQLITLRNQLENTVRNVGVQRSISRVSTSLASSNSHGEKRAAAVAKLVADVDKNFANLNESVEVSSEFLQKRVMDPETQKAINAVKNALDLEREVEDMARGDDLEDDAVSVTTRTTKTLEKRMEQLKQT